jgi:hypothetical protein
LILYFLHFKEYFYYINLIFANFKWFYLMGVFFQYNMTFPIHHSHWGYDYHHQKPCKTLFINTSLIQKICKKVNFFKGVPHKMKKAYFF